MRFQNYTTDKLRQLKSQFEYTAQMAALEKIEVDPASIEEYTELTQELSGREEVYREHSSQHAFRRAVSDCLLLIEQRSVLQLLAALGQGYEPTGKFAEVRLNPKNSFFREIVLQIDARSGNEETVRAGHFVPGYPIPMEWVRAEFADLSSPSVEADGSRRYDVLRLRHERSGRLEFVAKEERPESEEKVSRISVWCW